MNVSRAIKILTSSASNEELDLTEEEIALRGRVAETVCKALFDLANPDEVNAELNALEAIRARFPNTEWIPVTQDLPDDETTVLIHCPDEPSTVWMGYKDGDDWRCIETGCLVRVTHWMHLPETPEVTE